MKASDMTNEMLAGAVESIVTRRLFAINEEGYLREAAERLRKRIEFTPEMATEMCRREFDLRRRLKVAEEAKLCKQTRNCDGDRTDWRWYWGRYVTTQVCPCERKTATPEKHLRYFLNWLFLPKWVTGNDRDGEGAAK